jgi:hypothetical protein
MEAPNAGSPGTWVAGHGVQERDLARLYRTFYSGAPAFRAESEARDG